MKDYRKNRFVQIGFWPDPNPNPIGPGLFFFFTFWPAMTCLGIGTFQVWRKQRS